MSKARLRVLVVDDDLVDRLAVEQAVTSASVPIELTEASTVEGGLQLLGRQVYDCVLLDWRLPDGDATLFLNRVREVAPDVAVIVLTGTEGQDLAGQALQAGAQDYLEKANLDSRGLVRSIRYAVERKRAGDLKAQLLHSDRLGTIGQLAAGVAHEVNNPATWVLGNLTLLRERLQALRGSCDGVGEMINLVEDCRGGMERIVDTVRHLKRYAQPSPPRNDLLDLNAVIREAHRIARPETRHRARIELDLLDTPPLKGDAATLGQLVINLMINAAHALDKCPGQSHVIRVTTRALGGEIVLAVEDSGPGVPRALRARIFEPFFSTRTNTDGSGMGLAICRDIVRRHHGTLTVGDSQELGGARFEVRLACEDTPWGDMDTRVLRRTRTTESQDGDLRVLVVDDEPQILEVVTRLLGSCDVVTAGSGLEALERIGEDPAFDGILCDLMMPDMDGAELIHTLAAERSPLSERVVLCTGGAVTPQLSGFLSEAPCMVLHKPFTQGELAQVVEYWRDLREPV